MVEPTDALACYHAAIAAFRLRLIVLGDALPREDEPVDIVLLSVLDADTAPTTP